MLLWRNNKASFHWSKSFSFVGKAAVVRPLVVCSSSAFLLSLFPSFETEVANFTILQKIIHNSKLYLFSYLKLRLITFLVCLFHCCWCENYLLFFFSATCTRYSKKPAQVMFSDKKYTFLKDFDPAPLMPLQRHQTFTLSRLLSYLAEVTKPFLKPKESHHAYSNIWGFHPSALWLFCMISESFKTDKKCKEKKTNLFLFQS